MVLLSGLNYDYTSQQHSRLTGTLGTGSTVLNVENTEGFSVDDYIVVGPTNEKAEILQISEITSDYKLTTSAAKFTHSKGEEIYRLPYNQMKFYYSSSVSGSYTEIAGSETEMAYAQIYTNYVYAAGTSSLYYKRTFYNSTTDVESDIGEADYWQTGDEELYVTPEELRIYLQFGKNDYPNPEDMAKIIKVAQRFVRLEVDSSNQDVLFLATLMLSRVHVLKALASKSISKGYITVNVEGRNITKAYQELTLEAENTFKEYQEFVKNQTRNEVTKTNFMDNSALVSPETRKDFIKNWTGTSNAVNDTRRNYWNRRTR